ELLQVPDRFTRIYSTKRGYLTPAGTNAVEPAINDFGEVVYSGLDSRGEQEIFSTVRGQLTFFGGQQSVFTADLPDIDNLGNVVFRGLVNGVGGLSLIRVPASPTLLLFTAGGLALLGLAWRFHYRR